MVDGCRSTVYWLFDWLQTRNVTLSTATVNDIEQAMGCLEHGVNRCNRGTMRTYVRRSCGFCRFEEQQNWRCSGLA